MTICAQLDDQANLMEGDKKIMIFIHHGFKVLQHVLEYTDAAVRQGH